jgi:hypothetical protein
MEPRIFATGEAKIRAGKRRSNVKTPAHVLHGVNAVQDDRVNHGPILPQAFATKKRR